MFWLITDRSPGSSTFILVYYIKWTPSKVFFHVFTLLSFFLFPVLLPCLESLPSFLSTVSPSISLALSSLPWTNFGCFICFLFPATGSVCAAGAGQLPCSPVRPALRRPGPSDQRAELCWLECRQGPQSPEGCGRDPHWACGQGQVSTAADMNTTHHFLTYTTVLICVRIWRKGW